MIVNSYRRNECHVFRILDTLTAESDISELRSLVLAALENNEKSFAFSFTHDSYLYTRCVATIVECFEAIREKNGKMYFFDVGPDIYTVFSLIDFDHMIEIVPTEDDLP